MSKLETGIDGLEIRNTPGRGRSLYVTKAFKAGALVFEEDMMISMTGPVGDERMIQMERCCMKTNQVVDPLFIYAGLKAAKASESLQKSLLEEFYFPKGDEFKINGNTTMYRHNMWTTLIGDLHKQNLLEGCDPAKFLKLAMAWEHNAVEAPRQPPGPTPRCAIFKVFSKMNHSCDPNVWHHVNANDKQIVRAARDIEAGEELFISYVNGPTLVKGADRRNLELLNTKLFQCDCSRCRLDTTRVFICPNCSGPAYVVKRDKSEIAKPKPEDAGEEEEFFTAKTHKIVCKNYLDKKQNNKSKKKTKKNACAMAFRDGEPYFKKEAFVADKIMQLPARMASHKETKTAVKDLKIISKLLTTYNIHEFHWLRYEVNLMWRDLSKFALKKKELTLSVCRKLYAYTNRVLPASFPHGFSSSELGEVTISMASVGFPEWLKSAEMKTREAYEVMVRLYGADHQYTVRQKKKLDTLVSDISTCGATGCDNRGVTSSCSKCKAINYCSRGCQVGDWRRHKKICIHFENGEEKPKEQQEKEAAERKAAEEAKAAKEAENKTDEK